MSTAAIVPRPQPDLELTKSQIRDFQKEIADTQAHTYIGALTAHFEPTDYVYVPGKGQFLLNAEANKQISTEMGNTMLDIYGSVYPHVFPLDPDPEAYRFIGQLTNTAQPVNPPTLQFLARFFALLKAKGMSVNNVVSRSLIPQFMPLAWSQENYKGDLAWTVRPTEAEALEYLAQVHIQTLGLVTAAELAPLFQTENAGWVVDAVNVPYIYDAATRAAYGVAPVPWIQDALTVLDEDQQAYVDWLGQKVGDSGDTIVNLVKAAVPEAESGILLSTPKIILPGSHLLYQLNQPVQHWVFPKYDFIQIEDFDWVTSGQLELVPQTFQFALVQFNYPTELIQYLVGQALEEDTAKKVWSNIDAAWGLALEAGILHVYPWAYTQVVRDNVVLTSSKICGC